MNNILKNKHILLYILAVYGICTIAVCILWQEMHLAPVSIIAMSILWGFGSNYAANTAKYWLFLILVTIASSSFLAIDFLSELGSPQSIRTVYKTIGLFGLCAFAWLVVPPIFTFKFLRILSSFLIGLFTLTPCIIFWGYYQITGELMGADAVLAVAQTNQREAISYFYDFIPVSLLVYTGIAVIFLIALYLYLTHHINLRFSTNKKIIALMIVIFIVGMIDAKKNAVKRTIDEAENGIAGYNQFKEKAKERYNTNSELQLDIQSKEAGVFVLVIGESQNKNHMSAYGYKRDTTPWLDSMKKQNNFLFFEEAHSCHTHTVQVLSYAMTSKSQYNSENLEDAVSLIEIAKHAGYKTVWISNQVKYSAWDTPTSIIADAADEQIWLNHHLGESTSTSVYDMYLSKAVQDLQKAKKMLIVLHLMGNHGTYKDRYPSEYSKFKQKNKIDTYDNSILYNDAVVKEIYKTVQAIPNFKAMLYLSDHADDIDAGLGHDSSMYTQNMTEIPMYLICSPEYQKENQSMFNILERHQKSMFTNDLLFEFMLSLMQIHYPKTYEPQNDFTSSQYNGDKARFRTLHGKKVFE